MLPLWCRSSLLTAAGRTIRPAVRALSDDGSIEKSLNQVTLLGRVGTDPQLKGNSTHPVVTLSLATNTAFRPAESGSLRQRTEWHRISIFKPNLRDTVFTFVKKGSRILVSGRIMYGEIVDAKGVTHQTTSIVAEDVIFVSTKSDEDKVEVEQ